MSAAETDGMEARVPLPALPVVRTGNGFRGNPRASGFPVSPADDLFPAVRQAINDSESAAGSADHLLDLQARAAVEAVVRSGWVEQAGWEYAARDGDVTLSCGFHTADGALADARKQGFARFTVERRPIGLWEVDESWQQ